MRINKSAARTIYCTGLGKSILASYTDEKVREIIKGNRLTPFTENTITTYNELSEELEAIRERGYAIDNQDSSCQGIRIRFGNSA